MLIQSYSKIDHIQSDHPIAITIGVFDGIHLGHQKILETLSKNSNRLNIPSAVWTFSSLPPKANRVRIQHQNENHRFMKELGVSEVHVMDFIPEISSLSAQTFLEEILIKRLKAKAIVLGQEARIGKGREFSATDFLKAAADRGLQTEIINDIKISDQRISSTRIKTAISNGDLSVAEELLGHSYRISGQVKRDRGKGREIGFPTANISLDGFIHPPLGTYASTTRLDTPEGEVEKLSVSHIGKRPTFSDSTGEIVMETHLIDFNGDLYDKYIATELTQKLRDETKFEGISDLKTQITSDIEKVKSLS